VRHVEKNVCIQNPLASCLPRNAPKRKGKKLRGGGGEVRCWLVLQSSKVNQTHEFHKGDRKNKTGKRLTAAPVQKTKYGRALFCLTTFLRVSQLGDFKSAKEISRLASRLTI
jgi:hypothetical protein